MTVSYDVFIEAFLLKVTEYKFCRLPEHSRQDIVDSYLKRSCARFSEVCERGISNGDDENRTFDLGDIPDSELEDIIDIVSEGMLVQWMKPYVYAEENLQNMLNTADFSSYSPAELLHRIKETYVMCKKDFTKMIRDYSYRYGDLTDLHL